MEKLVPQGIENILPLTSLQEGMLFHYLNAPQSEIYFAQLSLEISGAIDVNLFKNAWNVVIQENEMLRTVFRWEKLEKPSQIILKEHACHVRFHDFSDIDSGQKKIALAKIKIGERDEGFDLTRVPFRVTLCKLAETQYEMIVSNHHILYDGWSNGIILKEFFHTYHALSKGEKALPLPAKPSFKEYIKWIQRRDKNKQEQFWRNYLAGFETAAELPIKRKKEEITGESDYSIILEENIKDRLEVFVKYNRVTLASVFYTAWGILLQKYGDSEDVIFGTPVSGRAAAIKDVKDMVGLFINTIPLRIQSAPNVKLIDIISDIENVLQMRTEFESTPLPDIRSYSTVEGSSSLFDTIVVIENYPLDNRLLPENSLLSITSYSMIERTHYDLSVGIMPFDEIEIKFSFKQELLDKDAIENLAGHFKSIIRNIIENPGTGLSQLEIISPEEKNRILYEFNNTATEYPRDKTIQQLFEEQALKTPDRVGVFGHGQAFTTQTNTGNNVGADLRVCPVRNVYPVNLTYRQLNEQSNRLAGVLIDKGVQPDTIVGIMVERSVEMVVGIIGILKSGGVYLPIDLEYPQERIDYMLKDSGVKLLAVANAQEGEKVGSWEGELLAVANGSEGEKLRSCEVEKGCPRCGLQHSYPHHLAYIIYTSGSTGRPKGVMINHSSAVNLLFAMQDQYPFTPANTYLLKTSYTFDVSVTELFGWYMGEGRLVILEANGEKDPFVILNWIHRHCVTHINFVPSMFNAFLDFVTEKNRGWLRSLKYIFLAGEALLPEHVKKFLDLNTSIELKNIYGPTEGTVYSSQYSLFECNKMSNIPIGKPLPNIELYILNKYDHLLPMGIPGDLYIGNMGVARGYLNNPELTSERFQFNRSYKSYKTYIRYKTGDLARWLPDGNIEFLGRIDQQIKIRGFRVELGEIETGLLKYQQIKAAVVILQGDGTNNKNLAAYFVSDRELSDAQLREHLLKAFPDYMIPSYFMQLEKIPLTSSGKVDRKRLPVPNLKRKETYVPPRREMEKKLVEIWGKVLGIDISLTPIGIDDSFFRLGGDSLKAISLVARIHKKLNIKIPLDEIFKRPTIRSLFDYINKVVEEKYVSIEPVEKKDYYELSSTQKRLYFLQQMDTGGTTYNISTAWVLEGIIDKSLLKQAFTKLIQRHESLRTAFIMIGEQPAQRIKDQVPFKIEYKNCNLSTDNTDEKDNIFQHSSFMNISNYFTYSFIHPFDLSNAPLLRVGLVKLTEEKHILIVDMHHIISDGISTEILIREFSALYSGDELPALSLRLQYKDYAEWQSRLNQEEYILKQGAYWKKEFADGIPVLELPTDYVRPIVQSFEGNRITFPIGKDTVKSLNSLTLETGTTLFMVLLALYNIFLAKVSGQEDIIFGTPFGGRRYTDLEKVVGVFINTLALRNHPVGEKNFHEFLGEVKNKTLAAFENCEYQYEDLVEQVVLNRDTSRNPLFDAMFVLQNMGNRRIDIPGLKLESCDLENKTSKFDLTLIAVENKEKLEFTFEYCTKLFKQETIERFITYYKNIIFNIIQDKFKRLADLTILSGEEKKRLLYEFNDTEAEYPKNKTIHQLFVEQAAKTPDYIAIVGNADVEEKNVGADEREEKKRRREEEKKSGLETLHRVETLRVTSLQNQITYRQLNEQSDRLAGLLIKKGVLPDNIVGIMMERSIEMIIGILGILKAGGAYLPLDPEYPQERIDYMLKDSGVKLLAVHNGLEDEKVRRWEGEKVLFESIIHHSKYHFFQHSALSIQHSKQLAYVIYTSGSTGRPKGVMINHGSAVNLLFAMQDQYPFTPANTYLLKTSYTFDVSVTELFGWYMGRGRLAVLEKDGEKDPQVISKWIEYYHITHINFVPSMFNMYISQLDSKNIKRLSSLKYIFLAGEALLPELVNKFHALDINIRLENIYGPTESSVYSSKYSLSQWKRTGIIPIGKPLPNIRLYILNKYNYLQSIGIPGELYINGPGLARGYLNCPELTAERFVLSPISLTFSLPQFLLYRTGDLCKWLKDGNIEFLGRLDHQIKIRGFRIELGEVENQILKYKEIKNAIVLEMEDADGDKYLAAYYVSDKEILESALKEYLTNILPHFMIPLYFIWLEKIPLNASGKVDRPGLPKPKTDLKKENIAPRNDKERKLVDIYKEILKVGELGITDNFFDLGGNSLKAIRLVSRIRANFGVALDVKEIFLTPTIEMLVQKVKNECIPESKPQEIFPIPRNQKLHLSFSQARLWLLDQLNPGNPFYNMPFVFNFVGDLNIEVLIKSFDEIVKRHEILRTSFYADDNGIPFQRINNYLSEYFKVLDLSNHDKNTIEIECQQIIEKEVKWIFNLTQGPLLRITLLKFPGNMYKFILVIHHIVSDGWSMSIILREFMTLYHNFSEGKVSSLKKLTIQYSDYAYWQRNRLQGDTLKNLLKYWKEKLKGYNLEFPIPTDYPRGQFRITDGAAIKFGLPPPIVETLERMAREMGLSLFMILAASINILLHLYSGQMDILIGTFSANRERAEIEELVGYFLNTLVLRTNLSGDPDIKQLLSQIKQTTLGAFSHQELPFELLIREINPPRKSDRTAIFQILFVLQNLDFDSFQLKDLTITHDTVSKGLIHFDIAIFMEKKENGINGVLNYNFALFKLETIQQIITLFIKILEWIVEDTNNRLSTLKKKFFDLKNKR